MYSTYTFENVFECTEADLELLKLGNIDQPLEMSTSILLVISTDNSWRLVLVFKLKETDAFSESLLYAIILDSSIKERSDNDLL